MQIYPEKYDKLVLSTSERSFLRTTERAFAEDELAYYVLQINPRKRDAGQGKAELFNMIIVPEGIMLLRFFDVDIPLVASTTIKALANPLVYSVLENDIRSKLEESNYLVRESGNLRFALNISFVFPNIDFSQMEPELTEPEKIFCFKHVLFKNNIDSYAEDTTESDFLDSGESEIVAEMDYIDKLSLLIDQKKTQKLAASLKRLRRAGAEGGI